MSNHNPRLRLLALTLLALTASSTAWAQEEPLASAGATEFVDVGGTPIAYRQVGEGEPLLLLHRFRASMDDWDPALIEALAAERQVIVFDSAGVSESEGDVPPTLSGAAGIAAGLIEALDLGPSDVLGWSMGGMTAQILAIEHPDLVDSLVLAGTVPPGNPELVPASEEWLETAGKPDYTDEDLLFLFYADSDTSRSAGLASLERITRGSVPGASVKTTPEVMQVQYDALLGFLSDAEGYFARLGEIQAPALVATGDQERAAPAVNSFVLFRELPQAELVVYPDSGHAFLFQYPERFANDVLDFLERQGSE